MDKIISHIRELIAKGKIDNAFFLLKNELNGSERLDSVLYQEARFSKIKEIESLGTIESSEIQRRYNQVIQAILKIVSDWKKNILPPKYEGKIKLLIERLNYESKLINDLALNYKKSNKFYFVVALFPILISVGFISFVWINNQSIETLQALASTLIASISGFPIREIVNRNEKVEIIKNLNRRIELLKVNPIEDEIKNVFEMIWGILKEPFGKFDEK